MGGDDLAEGGCANVGGDEFGERETWGVYPSKPHFLSMAAQPYKKQSFYST